MSKIISKNFDNDLLDVNYEYTWTHNANTLAVIPVWYDETGTNRTTTDVFTIISENAIKISCGESIVGTHSIVMSYQYAPSLTGKKLFEQTQIALPDDDHVIALGKASEQTINMTFKNFVTSASSQVGDDYFLKANNLSEISNQSIARDNLDVYSTNETDALLGNKCNNVNVLNQANSNSSNVSYSPSSAYNISTKKYVDDLVSSKLMKFTSLVNLVSPLEINGQNVNFTKFEYPNGAVQFNISFDFYSPSISEQVDTHILTISDMKYFQQSQSSKHYFTVQPLYLVSNPSSSVQNEDGWGYIDFNGQIFVRISNNDLRYGINFTHIFKFA